MASPTNGGSPPTLGSVAQSSRLMNNLYALAKSKIVHDRKSQTNEQLLDVTNNLRTLHDHAIE